jgi:hypothetical protein
VRICAMSRHLHTVGLVHSKESALGLDLQSDPSCSLEPLTQGGRAGLTKVQGQSLSLKILVLPMVAIQEINCEPSASQVLSNDLPTTLIGSSEILVRIFWARLSSELRALLLSRQCRSNGHLAVKASILLETCRRNHRLMLLDQHVRANTC